MLSKKLLLEIYDTLSYFKSELSYCHKLKSFGGNCLSWTQIEFRKSNPWIIFSGKFKIGRRNLGTFHRCTYFFYLVGLPEVLLKLLNFYYKKMFVYIFLNSAVALSVRMCWILPYVPFVFPGMVGSMEPPICAQRKSEKTPRYGSHKRNRTHLPKKEKERSQQIYL